MWRTNIYIGILISSCVMALKGGIAMKNGFKRTSKININL